MPPIYPCRPPRYRPSLKNVRELLRMRSADTITLEFAPWDGPVPGASDGSMPATGDSSSTPSAPGSVMASLDSMASSSSSESIGDRLQRQYAEAQSGGRTPTAVEQRIARRNARLELDNQRNDTPLVLGLFAAFALPPLVILLVRTGRLRGLPRVDDQSNNMLHALLGSVQSSRPPISF